MAFKDSGLWQNFINEGDLPVMKVETYVADDTLIKAAIIICSLIVVTILVMRATKPV